MKRLDVLTAAVFLLLSATVVVASLGQPYWAEFAPGSSFAPIWVGGTGIALSVLLAVQAFRRPDDRPADLPTRSAALRVLGTVGALVFAVAATPAIGLIGAMTVLVLVVLLIVARRPWPQSLATAALTMGLVWGVFVAWLGIAIPKGPLGI